ERILGSKRIVLMYWRPHESSWRAASGLQASSCLSLSCDELVLEFIDISPKEDKEKE
ncbi:hypothetical protein TNCV_3572671, partial [Trichonephila clavipes]